MLNYILTPSPEEIEEKHLIQLALEKPSFRLFLSFARIKIEMVPEGLGKYWPSLCGGSDESYKLFCHYKKKIIKVYTENKELVTNLNSELVLEHFFDLETGAELPVDEGEFSFKRWLIEEGGSINTEGMCYLLLSVFADHCLSDFDIYFEYGGKENWYRVFIRFADEDVNQFKCYYI
jgi:hypothetical protein